jgi:hypothetical protein
MAAFDPIDVRVASWRPLVRYVDADQAVLEIHLSLTPQTKRHAADIRNLTIQLEVSEASGFEDEHTYRLDPKRNDHVLKFDLVQPDRWWPAGMGEQSLYELDMALLVNGEATDFHTCSVGLASVRRDERTSRASIIDLSRRSRSGELRINGKAWDFTRIIPIDAADESGLLPITGDSLLVIRGHYAPQVLFDAADRAGILLLQSVPIDPEGNPSAMLAHQVDRLAGHASLAGWFVGNLGQMAEDVAAQIRRLDPTHNIFMDVPGELAA